MTAGESKQLPGNYFDTLRADLLRKHDLLADGLSAAGFRVFDPEGTYFITTDITPLGEKDGIEFCRSLVRFSFCKKDEVLAEAAARLRTL